MSITKDTVRAKTVPCWGDQTCKNPKDWPDAFDRMMHDTPPTSGADMTSANNFGRGSLKLWFEEAIDKLTAAFSADEAPPDPTHAVWCAFPRFDRQHCAMLAEILMAERQS